MAVSSAANFDRNLQDIQCFLNEIDAANLFPSLLDLIFERLIPNLEQHARLGRDLLARPVGSAEAQILARSIAARLSGGEVREYILDDYLVLDLVVDEDVTLLSIKHHRQLAFDLRSFWT